MREIPHSPVALHEVAHLFGTLIAETILASVPVRARKKAGHMGASDLIKALQNLARRGPSTYGESGFTALRSSLPMNLKAHFPGFKIWSRARADIDRIATIWSECLSAYGGPFLFGERSMADAMYAPVVTRFRTYDVAVDRQCAGYCELIMAMPEMGEWVAAALRESDDIEEFEAEF